MSLCFINKNIHDTMKQQTNNLKKNIMIVIFHFDDYSSMSLYLQYRSGITIF